MNAPVQQTVEAEKLQVTPTCKLKTRLIEPTAKLCQCLGQCRTALNNFLAASHNIGVADDCCPPAGHGGIA